MFLLMVLALMSTISQADVVACTKKDATTSAQLTFAGTCGTFESLKAQLPKEDASDPDPTEGACDFGTSGVCAKATAMLGQKMPTLPTGCTFGGMKMSSPMVTEPMCTTLYQGTYTRGTITDAPNYNPDASNPDAPNYNPDASNPDAPNPNPNPNPNPDAPNYNPDASNPDAPNYNPDASNPDAPNPDAPVTDAPVAATVTGAPVAAADSKAPIAAAAVSKAPVAAAAVSKAPVAAAAVSKAPVAAAAVTTAKPSAVGSFALIGLAVLAFLKF